VIEPTTIKIELVYYPIFFTCHEMPWANIMSYLRLPLFSWTSCHHHWYEGVHLMNNRSSWWLLPHFSLCWFSLGVWETTESQPTACSLSSRTSTYTAWALHFTYQSSKRTAWNERKCWNIQPISCVFTCRACHFRLTKLAHARFSRVFTNISVSPISSGAVTPLPR